MQKKILKVLIVIFALIILNPDQHMAFASIDNLEEKIGKIDAEIERNMEILDIPGMAFALVDANGILYSKGYGVLDIRDDNLKVNENTNFHIGSLTKVFVSVAIMKLHEEGNLSVEKPIVDYLPWFSTKDEQLSKEIKIKHLLSHTSGLPGRLNVHEIEQTERQEIINEVQKKLRNVRLVGKPGEIFEYTNMNFDLLQLVIEEVTGEKFTEYMENNIFRPLDMNRTGFYIFSNSHLPNTATGHRYHWEKIKPYNEELVYATSGSAGLSSNVNDLSKFINLLLNNGNSPNGPMISDSSFEQMLEPAQEQMAYSWYVFPPTMYIMDGGLPGFTSVMIISYDHSFGLVLLANSKQNITTDTANNLYWIVEGKETYPLLATDYTTLKSDDQLRLSIAIVISILTLLLVGLTIIQLIKEKIRFSFVKPGYKRIILISVICVVYIGAFMDLHVIGPFYTGVPTIFAFKMEPDFVLTILLLTIVYSIFSFVLLTRILFIRKTKT